VMNDVSVRDFQNRTKQFLQGKTFEHSTPLGPHLVTPDELPAVDHTVAVRGDRHDVRYVAALDRDSQDLVDGHRVDVHGALLAVGWLIHHWS